MLLMPNKKKMASMIVAGLGKKKPDYVQGLGEESGTGEFKAPESEESPDAGLEASMDALIMAVKDGNAKAAVKAFKELWTQCEAGEPDAEGAE